MFFQLPEILLKSDKIYLAYYAIHNFRLDPKKEMNDRTSFIMFHIVTTKSKEACTYLLFASTCVFICASASTKLIFLYEEIHTCTMLFWNVYESALPLRATHMVMNLYQWYTYYVYVHLRYVIYFKRIDNELLRQQR